jgi:hypothetical protein
MIIRAIKRFLISQRDAILMALAFSLVLYACGVLAFDNIHAVSRSADLSHFTAPGGAADQMAPDREPPRRARAR